MELHTSLTDLFLSEVETFLRAAQMAPTTFGRLAASDPGFVSRLRRGRACSTATVDRVRAWMASNEPVVTHEAEQGLRASA